MNKLIMVLLLVLAVPVYAGELSFNTMQMSRDADDNTYQVGDWQGVQVSYQPDKSDMYFFVSGETMSVYTLAKSHETNLTGLGFGIKRDLGNIRVFSQLGYYMTRNDYGRKRVLNEGILYYLNSMYGQYASGKYQPFHEYEVTQKDAFGGAIGIEMNHQITKNLGVGLNVSYRIMKIYESTAAYRDDWADDHYWIFGLSRNYSSTNLGLNVNYEF